MPAQVKMPSLLGRLARMTLTFFLVFGLSFHAEMALAAPSESVLKDHEEGALTNLTVAKLDDKGEVVKVDKKEGNSIISPVRSLANVRDDKNKDGIELAFGESVKLAAVPTWNGKVENAVAKFVTWKVGDKESDDTTVEVKNDKAEGGTVTVTCTLSKDDAKTYLAEKLEGTREISFDVKLQPREVVETKVIGDTKCVLTGTGLEEGVNTLKLTNDQAKEYKLTAKVSAKIKVVDQDGTELRVDNFSYSSAEAVELSEKSDLFNNIEWSLLDKNGDLLDASIATLEGEAGTKNKILKVAKGDCEFKVQYVVSDAATGTNKTAFALDVTCGDPSSDGDEPSVPDEPDVKAVDQGDSTRKQPTLAITGVIASSAMEGDQEAEQGDADESGELGDEAADQAEGSTQGESGVSAVDENSSSSSSTSETVEKNVPEYIDLNSSFSYDEDFEGTFRAQGKYHDGTFRMKSGTDGSIDVTGEGVPLKDLFEAMSIKDLGAIDEVAFVDDKGASTVLKWSAISDGGNAPLVATSSRVAAVEPEAGSSSSSTAEGESGSSGSSEGDDDSLLSNTRFRILFDDTASDADSLRYIREVIVNPSLIKPEPEPEAEDPDAPFTVTAYTVPGPLGGPSPAVFSPYLDEKIAGLTFDFKWYESSDGKTWDKEPVSTDQTYETLTTEDRLGHYFKVVVSSEGKNKETGEAIKYKDQESNAVRMTLPDGFCVQLIYDPPFAGKIASFQTRLIDVDDDIDLNKLKYRWELSTDGGKTWQKLANDYQGKPTLSIQTDPIDESDAWREDTKLTYIHVVVEYPVEVNGQTTKREVTSNAQLLTVRTGEDKGKNVDLVDDNTKKENNKSNNDDSNTTPSNDDTSGTTTDNRDEDKNEEPADADSGAGDSDTPQIHIDDEVTERINEQVQAEQAAVEATVPGARWTRISETGDDGEDESVLSENPFAPLAIPVGLGITFAGGLEKLLAFRRQL